MRILPFIGLALGLAATPSYGQATADLILTGGRVFTADPARPTAEALAIRGERIVAVGSSADISRLTGPATRRLDLQGRVVTPGFNDAHNHFSPLPAGEQLRFTGMEPNWDETAQAIRQAAAQVPAGTWIFGSVGAQVVLDERVTRAALDELAPRHPVLLSAYYGHGYVANSAALPKLGIAEEEPDPLGGHYEREAGSRRVNGRYWEYAQWKTYRALAAQVTDEAAVRELRQLGEEASRLGITSVQLFSALPIGRFVRLLEQARLPIRVRAIPFPTTSPRGRDQSELRELAGLRPQQPTLTVSGVKWVLDGTPHERGAALRRSYADRPGWQGKLNFGPPEIARMVQEAQQANQQLLLHCAGDQSAAAVLQALESYRPKVDWPARRVRIEHGDGVVGDLLPRARALGVVVVQNPAHFTEPVVFQQRWGTGMQPLRSLLTAGVPLALGSDGPLNPFLNVMLATLTPSNPAEAISREQAVQAYTRGSAFAEFAEKQKGTLAPGMLADVAVLSQDIFAVPPPQLPGTSSVLTIVGGQIVYDAQVLK
ncbi:amidohydrolase [Hymenobacter sp. B81]|uniref:amidohydrolase n=1 Tax=Hymenobacter sp. B81 TaxID=3344878 RepID=UPI0037DC00EF